MARAWGIYLGDAKLPIAIRPTKSEAEASLQWHQNHNGWRDGRVHQIEVSKVEVGKK